MSATNASDRYSRQKLFAGLGPTGQRRVEQSAVVIIGCGAMGSALANNLVRAGVGRVRLVDRDFVELNNLQRQTLYDERDVMETTPKAIAAARRLSAINSEVTVEPVVADFNSDNAETLLQDMDLALDGTDNFETRYLLNDVCVKLGKPWIYSGVIAAHGVSMTILPGETACLRCVFPDRPLPGTTPTCDTAGILNGIVAAIGGVSSTEALKALAGSDHLARGLLWMDLWENVVERTELPRQADCLACGQRDYEFLDAALNDDTATLCGRNAVQVRPAGERGRLDLAALATRLEPLGAVTRNEFLLRAMLDGYEVTVFSDARAIIKGTADPSVARTVYARYIGM
ncbi:MAG TPA: ThiF family adenylyltransferase [Ktedonobacterales bacterium]